MRLRNIHTAAGMIAAALSVLVALMLSASVAFADDTADILEPQHGIPLVIVNIDESEEGIAAAKEKDPNHEYGTIEDMNSSEKHTVRCVGNIEIKVPDGYELPEGDLAWLGTGLKLDYIRGRGNSTWDNDKKPYKIQLSKKADLFGMGMSKDWALMANFMDASFIHNRITNWLGKQLEMPYTTDSVPVDVVMTGANGAEYLGCYDLSETVKIEDSRVAIDKLSEQPDDIQTAGETEHQKTGGYLFSIFTEFQKDDPESNTFTTKNLVQMHFDNPEFLDEGALTDWQKEQRQYLKDYVQNIENLIVDSDEIDQSTHDEIAALLDLESVADYWLVQEFSHNGDAFLTGSTYFFKPRGDKMYFGPLWDFDLAWGEAYENEGEDDLSGLYGFDFINMLWIDELRAKDPEFVRIIEQEWAEMDPALTELTKSGGVIDRYRDEIFSAYNADQNIAAQPEYDLEASTEGLKRWIDFRHEWIADNLDKLGAVYAKVTYVVDGKTVFENKKSRIGRAASDNPAVPEKEGYYFAGWFTEDGQAMSDVNIEADTVFYAKYVTGDEAVLPTHLYLQEYELWEEAGNIVSVAFNYSICPSDVISDKVTWTSSDDSIAEVDRLGFIFARGPGDVILTASTINGIQAELHLHVVEAGELHPAEPEGIAAEEPEISLKTGDYTQVKWHYLPEGQPIKNYNFTFDTSDDEVAVVDSMGVVTAIGPGTADITMTVYCGDDEDARTITATFKVTVKDPEDPSDAADRAEEAREEAEKAKAEAEAARMAAEEAKAAAEKAKKQAAEDRRAAEAAAAKAEAALKKAEAAEAKAAALLKKAEAAATAKGTKHKSGGSTYKVTKNASGNKAGTVALTKAANKKSVKVPATVTINKRKFKVTQIDAGAFKGKKIRTVTIGKNVKTIKKNAFNGSKATKLIIRSKSLTKKSVKGSLNKSRIKKAQVKVGKKSVNKKYKKKYKKIFTKKNAGRKVKIS